LVPVLNDDMAFDATSTFQEVKMQICTQLSSEAIENLFESSLKALDHQKQTQFEANLRDISSYNYEIIKERVKGFMETVIERHNSNIDYSNGFKTESRRQLIIHPRAEEHEKMRGKENKQNEEGY
jgi:hypothetical protein